MTMKYPTKKTLNIAISLVGVGIVVFYSICGGSCSYLRGDVFGVDLKYIGVAYMLCIIGLSLFNKNLLILLLVSGSVGVEVYLIGFQVVYGTFCPFCLAFGLAVLALMAVNFDWSRKWYMISLFFVGILFFLVFFKGSVLPRYDF